MKKMMLAMAAIAMMTVSAQAVSFTWTSASIIAFNGSNLTTSGAFTANLVYLGTGATATWANYLTGVASEAELTSDGTVQTAGVRLTGGASNVGKIFGTVQNLNGNQNYVYGVIVVHNDGTDDWYNLSSLFTVPNVLDNVSGGTFASAYSSFATQTTVTDANLVGTSGWYKVTPVPEPATAALAIAGLAMLIRRRK